MKLRDAELEIIEYRVGEIGHATNKLIDNYVNYSGIAGTESWPFLWYQLLSCIRDQTGVNLYWLAQGMEVKFSYFLDPRPTVADGKVVFTPPEPSIAFLERPEGILPTKRTHLQRVVNAITEEMKDVYHLRVEKDPLKLVFPNQEYARKIERFRAPILNT